MRKRFARWRLVVSDYACIPKGYGVYDRDVLRERKYCCPLPFNLLLGFGIRLYWRCVRGVGRSKWQKVVDERARAAYMEGFNAGTVHASKNPRPPILNGGPDPVSGARRMRGE